MIRTLIVEDEYFVRQGFVHSLPWESYGIRIVGEADNGEAALQFLREHEVDLLITDLTMPVKSGLELLHETKELYPALPSVVLTCHRDFEFIQEALRLGAVDYIVKTRLDTSEIERSLGRIRERLSGLRTAGWKQDTPLLFVPLPQADSDWPARLRGEQGIGLGRIGNSAWLTSPPPGDLAAVRLAEEAAAAGWAAVRVTDWHADDIRGAERPLADYAARSFPYRCGTHAGAMTVSLAEAKQRSGKRQSGEWDAIVRKWHSYAWVFEESELLEWSAQVRECEPPPDVLGELLADALHGWSLSEALRHAGIPAFEAPTFVWEQWAERLRRARACLRRRFDELHYSREVYSSALKSLDVIRKQLKDGLHQSEVARHVGLSRSYFSQVFKETFGLSFNEYVRACSIGKARKLLSGTDYPIYWIAEQSGFQDERYFSRIFRERTGLLPSEFRSRCRADVNGGPA